MVHASRHERRVHVASVSAYMVDDVLATGRFSHGAAELHAEGATGVTVGASSGSATVVASTTTRLPRCASRYQERVACVVPRLRANKRDGHVAQKKSPDVNRGFCPPRAHGGRGIAQRAGDQLAALSIVPNDDTFIAPRGRPGCESQYEPSLVSCLPDERLGAFRRGLRSTQENMDRASMPGFYFHLRAQGIMHRDTTGSECPDLAAARLHADGVASELMRNNQHSATLWSLRVEDQEARQVFDLFFADVADNGAERSSEAQALARKTSRRLAALIDVASSAHETMMQSAALLARIRGKPQLAYCRKAKSGVSSAIPRG